MFFTAAFQGQALVYPMLDCHRSRHFAGRAFRWHRGVIVATSDGERDRRGKECDRDPAHIAISASTVQ